ncbi:UNKNOWN [Stylonychia lemnae]|uniref:Uncharacterized protein n=1 Tax=Stylonychia lemnae TaxID=5949 RepID=A0A078ASK5_STYLE|nr:UNKNOWN [Stylonychia lemnae]|eukprot:CDW85154.1 UNKNOWN [Stylonychia lemnae]
MKGNPNRQNFKVSSSFNQQRPSTTSNSTNNQSSKNRNQDAFPNKQRLPSANQDGSNDYMRGSYASNNPPQQQHQNYASGISNGYQQQNYDNPNRNFNIQAQSNSYNHYGLASHQRDSHHSAFTSIGAMNTITQPSVSNYRDMRSQSPLDNQSANVKSRRYKDFDPNTNNPNNNRDFLMSSTDNVSNYYQGRFNNKNEPAYLRSQKQSIISAERQSYQQHPSFINKDSIQIDQQPVYIQNYNSNGSKNNKNILSPKTYINDRREMINSKINHYQSEETLQDQIEDENYNIDMQDILMNLHSKMKSLENKYIDLANFYKMGAIKQKQQSILQDTKSPNKVFSNTADNFYTNQSSKSPLRLQSQALIAQEELDTVKEKNIISELLHEKSDLDRELQNIVKLQSKFQKVASDKNQDQFDTLARDTYEQRQMNQNPSGIFPQGLAEEQAKELQNNIQNTLTKFENEFILYINQNYNSFTENDILGLFANLKREIISIITSCLRNSINQELRTQNSQPVLRDNQTQQLLINYQKDQNEFEINQEYTIQTIKKCVFDLQNKQDLALLDLKKSQMLLQNITKSSHDLCIATMRQKEIASGKAFSGQTAFMSSPRNLAITTDQLATEISSHVKILGQSFQSLNQKILSEREELQMLGSIQDELNANLGNLKRNFSIMISQFDNLQPMTLNSERLSRKTSNNDLSHRQAQKELDELKALNDNLQQELRNATDKLQKLSHENHNLVNESQKRGSILVDREREISPISVSNMRTTHFRMDSIGAQAQMNQTDGFQQRNQVDKLKDQNMSLERQVKSLARTLQEKNDQIDRLGTDLNSMSQFQNLKTIQNQDKNQNVSLDQLQFYQQYADNQQQKLRQLIRQTQKFLYSMKKLQKAVHKKEPNVQKEKSEFEESRKELEYMLRQMKKDLDENITTKDDKLDMRPGSFVQTGRFNQIAERNHSAERTEGKPSAINPHYNQSRNPASNYQQQSQYKRLNQHQVQNANDQNSMITSINPISDLSYHKDKSPILLRQKVQRRNEQRELFKSIEPYERRVNNLLMTSLSLERQQRSPSVGDPPNNDRYGLSLSRYQSPSANPSAHQQVQHDVDILSQQIKELRQEREINNQKLIKIERDKDSYQLQKSQMEHEMDRLRRIIETLRQENTDLQEERRIMRDDIQQAQYQIMNMNNQYTQPIYNSLGQDNQMIQALEQKLRATEKELRDQMDKSERLFEQVQLNDRITAEFKRTVGFLEENVESAKRTIMDQKESIQQKEKQVEEYKQRLHQIKKQTSNAGDQKQKQENNEKLIQELETQIIANLSKFEEIDLQIKEREQDIGKLKRLLDRKLKEQEIQQINLQQEKSSSQKIQASQLNTDKIAELENKVILQTKDPQILDSDAQIKLMKSQAGQHEINIENLKEKYENKLHQLGQQLEEEMDLIKDQNRIEIEKIQKAHKQDLAKQQATLNNKMKQQQDQHNHESQEMQQEHQVALQEKLAQLEQQLKTQHQKGIEELQRQLKDKHDAQMKKKQDQYENKMQQEIERLTESMKNDDQIEVLQQMHAQERQQWTSEKSRLEGLVKDEQNKIKKAVLSKEEEIKSLKNQLMLELEELRLQQTNNEGLLQKAIDSKEQVIKQLNDKIKSLQSENETKLQAKTSEIKSLKTQLQQLEDQNQQLEDQINDLQIARQQSELKLNQSITNQDKNIKQLQKDLQGQKEQNQKDLLNKDSTIDDLKQQVIDLEEQIKHTQTSLSSQEQQLMQKIEQFKLQIKAKDSQISTLQTNVTELNDKIISLTQDISDKDFLIQQKDQQIQQIQQNLQKKIDKLDQDNQVLKQLRTDQEKQSQAKLADFQEQIDQKEQQVEELNELLNDQKTTESRLNKQIENAKLDNEKIRSQANQAQASLESQISKLKLEVSQRDEIIEQKIKQLENLQSRLSDHEKETGMAKILRQSLQQQLDKQQKELNEKELKQADKEQQILNQLQAKDQEISNLESDLEQKDKELGQKDKEIISLQKDLRIKEKDSKQRDQFIMDKDQEIQDQAYEIEQLQQELHSKDRVVKQKDQDLQLKVQELQQRGQDMETLQEQINEFEQQVEELSQANNEFDKQNQKLQDEIEKLQSNQQNEITQLNRHSQEQISKKDQQIKELISEKEKLQNQVKEMVNQTTFEKQSLEGKLQQQLNETMSQLQDKEKQNHDLQNQIQEYENLIRQYEQNEQDFQQKIQGLQEENYQLQTEYQEKEEYEKEKYNQSLESNRNVIQMLKTELQKALDQQKNQENQKNDSLLEKETQLNNQIQQLQQQNLNLRQEFDEKSNEQKQQLEGYEQEIAMKNELIEECNKLMEEFNDEKHEIKAKFKHLVQVLDSVDEESSYKEDDDIDLEDCFEKFEKEFMKSKQRMESRMDLLERDNSILRQEVQMRNDELNQIQIKMADLQAELMNAINKQDANDVEVRKKLDNAQKKIQNYKDKLVEKQKMITELEQTMKQLIEMNQRNSQNLETNTFSQQKEKTDLISKLSIAQSELMKLKQIQQQQQQVQAAKTIEKETIERVEQLEIQVMQFRKLIFMAKNQVIDEISDTFARKIKDIQNTFNSEEVLRAKLSEMKTNQQIDTLNSNIKLIKYFTFGAKRLLVVQVISNNECYVIDDSKLTETALNYLKSYLPGDDKELDDTYIHIDDAQQQLLEQLQEKLSELRAQRNDLQVQLKEIKANLTSAGQIDKKKDLQFIQLEDEVVLLSKEVAELRIKQVEHRILETHLRSRTIELNEMIKELTYHRDAESANRKVIKLMEENESLRQQVSTQSKKLHKISQKQQLTINDEDELVEEGDFFKGIEVADNLEKSQQPENDDVNLFDQSSLYGVIEGINDEERKYQNIQDDKVKQLEIQLEEIQKQNQTLQGELQRSQQQNSSINDKALFENVKGTLIPFLKNCPMTDKNNEVILEIIFDMMEFTEAQIAEVQDIRKKNRSGSISASGTETEEEVKKQTKKGIFGMFKKKEGSTTRKPEEVVSPIRPIRR